MKKVVNKTGGIHFHKLFVVVLILVLAGVVGIFLFSGNVKDAGCKSETYNVSLDLPDGWVCKVSNDRSMSTSNPATINIESTNFDVVAGNIGRLFGAESDQTQTMSSEEYIRTEDFAGQVYYLNGVVLEIDIIPLYPVAQEFKIIAKPKITNLAKLDSNQRDEILQSGKLTLLVARRPAP